MTVTELLDSRDALGVKTVLVKGYWSSVSVPHSCAAPIEKVGDLELYCHEGEFGLTESSEAIATISSDGAVRESTSPHIYPFVPSDLSAKLLSPSGVMRATLAGHFNDPRAKDCRPVKIEACTERFVIERIVDLEAVDTAAVARSPFPFKSPPGPPFVPGDCAGDVPYSFIGWADSKDLDLDRSLPDIVYAAVTRDVVVLGDWIEDPAGSGEEFRTMGRQVCYAREGETKSLTFAWVPGSAYREWRDGRRTQLEP